MLGSWTTQEYRNDSAAGNQPPRGQWDVPEKKIDSEHHGGGKARRNQNGKGGSRF